MIMPSFSVSLTHFTTYQLAFLELDPGLKCTIEPIERVPCLRLELRLAGWLSPPTGVGIKASDVM